MNKTAQAVRSYLASLPRRFTMPTAQALTGASPAVTRAHTIKKHLLNPTTGFYGLLGGLSGYQAYTGDTRPMDKLFELKGALAAHTMGAAGGIGTAAGDFLKNWDTGKAYERGQGNYREYLDSADLFKQMMDAKSKVTETIGPERIGRLLGEIKNLVNYS